MVRVYSEWIFFLLPPQAVLSYPSLISPPLILVENTPSPSTPSPPLSEKVLPPPGKLLIVGRIPPLATDISSLSCCPFAGFHHLVPPLSSPFPIYFLQTVVGTQSGYIQLLNLSSQHKQVVKEFVVSRKIPVRGIRWLDEDRIIFFLCALSLSVCLYL